jgi:putative transcriptional regulator
MENVEYEWDEAKAAANFAKHGISFTAAARALEDPQKIDFLDDRFEYGEERIQSLCIYRETVLFVVTVLPEENVCRIISARRQPDMSKNNTSKVVRYSRENLPADKTDWARIGAMTDEDVVAAALSDPDAQPLAPEQLAKMRRVSRVRALRQRLGMTQTEFAEAFHLPITTLRDWEQRRSTPDAPARALLLAIERDPEVMRRLLAERAA